MFGRATPSDLNYRHVVRWTGGLQHAGTHSESRFGACWVQELDLAADDVPGGTRDRADRRELSAVASSQQGLDLSDCGGGDRDGVR